VPPLKAYFGKGPMRPALSAFPFPCGDAWAFALSPQCSFPSTHLARRVFELTRFEQLRQDLSLVAILYPRCFFRIENDLTGYLVEKLPFAKKDDSVAIV
jgi:hypothetical protein